jgi:hypothetical protein
VTPQPLDSGLARDSGWFPLSVFPSRDILEGFPAIGAGEAFIIFAAISAKAAISFHDV